MRKRGFKILKLRDFSGKRTIQTERPPHVGQVSANILRIEGVVWSAQWISTAVNLDFLDPESRLLHSSSYSVTITRLGGPRSRLTASQKIWYRWESNPGALDLQPGTLTTRPQRRSKRRLEWINLAQDKDQWLEPLNTVMNFKIHKMLRMSLVNVQLLASQGLRSIQLVHLLHP
jgi:hypothetical protein